MKQKITIILLLTKAIMLAQSASLPNLNLELATCVGWNNSSCAYDPFYNNLYSTAPWFISHGSPQIFTTNTGERGFVMGSVPREITSSFCDITNKPSSEGVFYGYPFFRGQEYKVSFEYKFVSTNINTGQTFTLDKAWVSFYNGLTPAVGDDIPGVVQNRCYKLPVPTSDVPNANSKAYFIENAPVNANGDTDVNSGFTQAEFCIVADRNYNQLWMSLYDASDNILISNQENAAIFFLVKNIKINGSPYCDQDLVFNWHQQDVPLLPGVTTKHPFEPIVQARSISLFPTFKLEILPGTTPRPRNTTFQASNFIQFSPIFGNWDSSNVEIQPDGYFEAVIQDCESTFNFCNDYIPWASNLTNYEPGFFIPNAVNYCSNLYVNRIWRVNSVFPRHYNASRVRYDIFEQWGSHVYGNEWNKTCDELEAPIDFIKWHLPSNRHYWQLYIYQIQLENCHGTKLLAGDFIVGCSYSREQDGEMEPVEVDGGMLERAANPPKYEITLSPNPASDHVRLSSESWPMKNIKILNVNGNIVVNHNCQNGLDELVEISSLPAGVYFASIEVEDQVFSIKFVKN